MLFKMSLAALAAGLIIIACIYFQIPKPAYVLVIDQRAIDSRTAAKVADVICARYEISEIYWVFGHNDNSYYRAAHSFHKPDSCQVIMTDCIGSAIANAYKTLFNRHQSQPKALLFLRTGDYDQHDIDIINSLPYKGVIIYELDDKGNETRVPGT